MVHKPFAICSSKDREGGALPITLDGPSAGDRNAASWHPESLQRRAIQDLAIAHGSRLRQVDGDLVGIGMVSAHHRQTYFR